MAGRDPLDAPPVEVAIALMPVLLAYLQLGYHPDVADDSPDVSGSVAVSYLDRSVHDAAAETAGDYAWAERGRLAAVVRQSTDDDVATLEPSRLEEGVAYQVAYNASAAVDWMSTNRDRSDGKRFGSCEADGSVGMQERAGEAVLLAVAFDVRVVGPDGETELTVVGKVGG